MTAFGKFHGLRKGDVVECSFSITGAPPLFKNYFSGLFSLNYSVPVNQLIVNINYGSQKPDYKIIGLINDNDTLLSDNGSNLKITQFMVKEIVQENDVPSDIDQYLSLQLSLFKNWRQVTKSLTKYYQDLLIQDFDASDIGELKTATDCIRFVQDEIRYFGFEDGIQGWVPKPIDKILADRYGDCKEKSVLLVKLLREKGLEAYPFLVNSNERIKDSAMYLPSPYIFDHCIVKVIFRGNSYFIDPTISN